jgi:hypothetical protein
MHYVITHAACIHKHTSCEPLLKTLKIYLVLRHFSLALSMQSQHDTPHSAPFTANNKNVSSLSIYHIPCLNVKLSVTHSQFAAGESVLLASQLSQHNPTTGLPLRMYPLEMNVLENWTYLHCQSKWPCGVHCGWCYSLVLLASNHLLKKASRNRFILPPQLVSTTGKTT